MLICLYDKFLSRVNDTIKFEQLSVIVIFLMAYKCCTCEFEVYFVVF